MKKIIALVIAAILCISMVAVVASADDEPTNVAANATYEVHDIFRMSTVTWGYDEEYPEVYADETGKQLIDGLHAETNAYSDTAWVGMSSAHPNYKTEGQYIIFTLDKAYDVGTILITLNNLQESGVGAPSCIEAYYSNDGTEWKGGYEGDYTEELVAGESAVYEIKLDRNTQYIKLDYTPGDGTTWMFTDEVEIYDDGDVDPDAESKEAEASKAAEESKAATESETESAPTAESSEAPATQESGFPVWLIIVIAVAVIAVVVVVIIVSKKKK